MRANLFQRTIDRGGDNARTGNRPAIKDKVRSRQQSCFSSFIAESASEESFGEKLKKAVEEKSGQKRRKEQVERERSRYSEPRKRGKGE
jgi:hypothetical protein